MDLTFYMNTFQKSERDLARGRGMGLEVEEYMWESSEDEIAEKRAAVTKLMEGFDRFSFHGTTVTKDFTQIRRMPEEKLLGLYEKSYQLAAFHGIQTIVFHSDYFPANEPIEPWFIRNRNIWRAFLRGKPASLRVYLENVGDDAPDPLARLCDAIDDERFGICLDIGHANCNSKVPLTEWVTVLGKRIGHVHVHSNDGISDQHLPMAQGTVEFKPILELLQKLADHPACVLECEVRASMRWLSENGYCSSLAVAH